MNNLNFLSDLANDLESKGFYKEASDVHNLFIKKADQFNKKRKVEFPTDVEGALNNFDSKVYELDTEGEWQNTIPIPKFIKQAPEELMHAPAAVDKNHLIFENPDNKKIEVMNVIPENHLDTLHDPSKEDDEDDEDGKFIKRADD